MDLVQKAAAEQSTELQNEVSRLRAETGATNDWAMAAAAAAVKELADAKAVGDKAAATAAVFAEKGLQAANATVARRRRRKRRRMPSCWRRQRGSMRRRRQMLRPLLIRL
jgi:hypothetical protein